MEKAKKQKTLVLVCILSVIFFLLFSTSVYAADITISADRDNDYHRTRYTERTVAGFQNTYPAKTIKISRGGVELSAKDITSSGDTIEVDGKQYTLIVRGDISKNGKLSALDLSLIKAIEVGNIKPDEVQKRAADINDSKTITTLDRSLLSCLLVGIDLTDTDPDLTGPKVTEGSLNIVVTPSEVATKTAVVSVTGPTGQNLEGCVTKISTDNGVTYTNYTAPITVNANGIIRVSYQTADGTELATKLLRIENIDTVAPNEFTFTATKTTSTITVNATTEDKITSCDDGSLIQNEYSYVEKYLYKLNEDGEWQEGNTSFTFEELTADTDYKVYVKAVDKAGNETEATNNELIVHTDAIITDLTTLLKATPDITRLTCLNVTIAFTIETADQAIKDNYDIEYQVGATTGEWVKANSCIVATNCAVYARLVDKDGQASSYITVNIANIDKLEPLEFTPVAVYNAETDETTVTATVTDAPADEYNACSGIAESYTFFWLDAKGGWSSKTSNQPENYEILAGDLATLDEGEDNPIVGVVVYARDNAGNTRRGQLDFIDVVHSGFEFNDGPGNTTINNLSAEDSTESNPVIPVGFRPVETDEASWNGVTPQGWDNGLVIEDRAGNEFVWVPVPCAEGTSGKDAIDALVLNNRGVVGNYEEVYVSDDIPSAIEDDEEVGETADVVGKYGYTYEAELVKQVETYKGFYVARYEAGTKDGALAVQKGLQTINCVTYEESKNYAESLYTTPYVVSGIPTGVHADLVATWIAKGTNLLTRCDNGNTSGKEFTFTGEYAEGPDFGSGEVRGEYKTGTDVHKVADQEILLTTGIVEAFRMKNIYDLWGNVWEYTSEHVNISSINNVPAVNAVNCDYYWEGMGGPNGAPLGFGYRGYVPDGDARNEGGFRPVLYLSEGEAKIEALYNDTFDHKAPAYNNPIIPAGYEVVDEEAWANKEWNNGLVIQDAEGNQFVWVPVDGTDVTYEKWLDRFIEISETSDSDLAGETEQITNFGGFYIARYETSLGTDDKLEIKNGKAVATNITYNEAVTAVADFTTGPTSTAGIITGTQWDTVMRWIANEKGEDAVKTNSGDWGNYSPSAIRYTGGSSSIAKNIYDLAGNAWEFTSENVTGDKIAYRGGSVNETGDVAPAGYRGEYEKTKADINTTFRMVLYVEKTEINPNIVEVDEKEGMPGSDSIVDIQVILDPPGWTTESVTATLTTSSAYDIMYSVVPVSTGVASEWVKGNQVTVTERSTILKKLVDAEGKNKSMVTGYLVWNIDKVAPNDFTVQAEIVENNRIKFSCKTTDDLSGVKNYHFFIDNDKPVLDCIDAEEVNNAITIEIPVGKHTFYVRAYDNAGNYKDSAIVNIETAGRLAKDVLYGGQYVSLPMTIMANTGITRNPEVMGLEGKYETIQVWDVHDYGEGDGIYMYNKTVGPESYYYPFYIGGSLPDIGSPHGITTIKNGSEFWYQWSLGDIKVLRGNGTKDNPYVLDAYWGVWGGYVPENDAWGSNES